MGFAWMTPEQRAAQMQQENAAPEPSEVTDKEGRKVPIEELLQTRERMKTAEAKVAELQSQIEALQQRAEEVSELEGWLNQYGGKEKIETVMQDPAVVEALRIAPTVSEAIELIRSGAVKPKGEADLEEAEPSAEPDMNSVLRLVQSAVKQVVATEIGPLKQSLEEVRNQIAEQELASDLVEVVEKYPYMAKVEGIEDILGYLASRDSDAPLISPDGKGLADRLHQTFLVVARTLQEPKGQGAEHHTMGEGGLVHSAAAKTGRIKGFEQLRESLIQAALASPEAPPEP